MPYSLSKEDAAHLELQQVRVRRELKHLIQILSCISEEKDAYREKVSCQKLHSELLAGLGLEPGPFIGPCSTEMSDAWGPGQTTAYEQSHYYTTYC